MTKLAGICLLLLLIDPQIVQAQHEVTNRRGITFSLSYGYMYQQDQVFGHSKKGQELNAGIGMYLRNDLALFLRGKTNQVTHLHRHGLSGRDYRQVTEFLGMSLQYWINERIYIEGGSGLGHVRHQTLSTLPGSPKVGFTALLGTGISLYDTGKGLIRLGIEDAFIVLDNKYVHNVGLNIGYQLK